MRRTRTVTLLLAGATALALSLAGVAIAAADQPANRGWHHPGDVVSELSGR